jgi:ribosome assembly protein 4
MYLTSTFISVFNSPRGKILASGGGDTTVRFWDVNTCLPIYCGKEHTQPVLSTMWSPDGKLFVSGDQGGNVLIWDPFKKKTATQIVPVEKDNDEPKEDTATSNKNPKQPSTSSPSLLVGRIKAHSKHITSMAFEPMHRIHHLRLSNIGIKYSCERFVTASKDGLAKIWNVRTKQCEATLSGHLEGIECVKWYVCLF